MSDENNLSGFLGGSLNQRLIRSARLDRLAGGGEEALVEQISDALRHGKRALDYGAPVEAPQRRALTPTEEVEFERRAVAEMVSAFGGATRTLEREQRRRRRAEIEAAREQRLNQGEEVGAEVPQVELPQEWLDYVADTLAEEQENDEDEDDDYLGQVAWR